MLSFILISKYIVSKESVSCKLVLVFTGCNSCIECITLQNLASFVSHILIIWQSPDAYETWHIIVLNSVYYFTVTTLIKAT